MTFLYETHMHTAEASACGISTGAEQARRYAEIGYAGIIVTDHFLNGSTTVPYSLPWKKRINLFISGYLQAKEAGESLGLDVFLGWEFNVNGQEFLTYGLDYEFLLAHPETEHMGVPEYSKLVRGSGGYLAQAHPYRHADYIGNYGAVDAKYIDGVEVYNAHNGLGDANDRALAFAKKHGLPMQAGTDSHETEQAFTSGISLKRRAKNIFDIIEAIKNGDVGLITP